MFCKLCCSVYLKYTNIDYWDTFVSYIECRAHPFSSIISIVQSLNMFYDKTELMAFVAIYYGLTEVFNSDKGIEGVVSIV